ncbi:MAG: aquaporin [Defluviitaleaceae bacterium]|nr:aquaporin [Defluviitaleaceae bacterium]
MSELLAEFLGSMFLVMAAVSSMILFDVVFEASVAVAVFTNAITVAFVLCALIEVFAPISGAHFNPVVTLAIRLDKKITTIKALLYVLVQFAGGVSGVILSHLMFFDEIGALVSISETTRGGHMYLSEIIGTFILVLVILLLIANKSGKASVIVGLLVGGQVMATSSTMFANPQVTAARILTATASGIRPFDAAIFIFMQIIGAVLAFVIYKFFFARQACSEHR